MSLKPKKLRRISNNSERARTATRDEPDALAVPSSVRAMPGSDLQLARMLLGGYTHQNRRGRRRSRYLKEGSQQEVDARRAIARLLRSNGPLDRQLRTNLADLFEPSLPPAWEQRKITIGSRRRGRRVDHISNTQIAEHVWEQVGAGAKVTAAIESAADEFGVEPETITKIWGKYKRLLEAIYGPARAPRSGP